MNEPNEPEQDAACNELWLVLHEEVSHLPKKYRLPVILGCLEGKSNEEVAAILEWPVGLRAQDLSITISVALMNSLTKSPALSPDRSAEPRVIAATGSPAKWRESQSRDEAETFPTKIQKGKTGSHLRGTYSRTRWLAHILRCASGSARSTESP
jgi:hypothetical protein